MSDTVQKLLRQRADGAGPALLAGDQQWSWREYVEESSRRVLNTTRRGEGLARDARHADCQIILTDTGHRPLLDGLDLGGARVLDVDGPEWKRRSPMSTPGPR